MIHTANISNEWTQGVSIDCDALAKLHTHGFPFDPEETYSVINVKQDDEDSGYLVQKGESLKVPLNFADAVADKCELWLCNCPDYLHRTLDNIEDAGVGPEELEYCKHCIACDRTLKARQDKNQETL